MHEQPRPVLVVTIFITVADPVKFLVNTACRVVEGMMRAMSLQIKGVDRLTLIGDGYCLTV